MTPSAGPNILWVHCDELRADALGCYGNASFTPQAPHLDALARSGVRFTRCYTTSPVCVPARMATMTGLHPEQTGVYHNEAAWDNFRPPVTPELLPETFARAGYATANFGKVHLPRGLQPWQHWDPAGGTMGAQTQHPQAHRVSQIRPVDGGSRLGGAWPGDVPYPGDQMVPAASEWIAGQEGPWFARLGFIQPHTPVWPPPPYDQMLADVAFPQTHPDKAPNRFEERFGEVCRWSEMPSEHRQLVQQHYYGLVNWVDAQVGRMLDFLDETGLRENTIVVFDADHGAALGEGNRYAKHVYSPEVHRVPRLIAWPGTLSAGQVRDDLCDGVDLPRTLCGLAGIDLPQGRRGRDLFSQADVADDHAVMATIGYGLPASRAFPNGDKGVFDDGAGWPRRSCIRTDRWRLDRTVRLNGEHIPADDPRADIFLADSHADPREVRNLARAPEHAAVRDELLARLDAHLAGCVEVEPELVARPG